MAVVEREQHDRPRRDGFPTASDTSQLSEVARELLDFDIPIAPPPEIPYADEPSDSADAEEALEFAAGEVPPESVDAEEQPESGVPAPLRPPANPGVAADARAAVKGPSFREQSAIAEPAPRLDPAAAPPQSTAATSDVSGTGEDGSTSFSAVSDEPGPASPSGTAGALLEDPYVDDAVDDDALIHTGSEPGVRFAAGETHPQWAHEAADGAEMDAVEYEVHEYRDEVDDAASEEEDSEDAVDDWADGDALNFEFDEHGAESADDEDWGPGGSDASSDFIGGSGFTAEDYYRGGEYEPGEPDQYEVDDYEEDYEEESVPGEDGGPIEEPRRRFPFYRHSSDDHHRRRNRRRRQRDDENNYNYSSGYASAAAGGFIGLVLFVMMFLVLSIVAGTAVIEKQIQSQPGNPTSNPNTKPVHQPSPNKRVPIPWPPWLIPPPIIPIPPPVGVPIVPPLPVPVPLPPPIVVLPPVGAPPVGVPPIAVPPTGPTRPPSGRPPNKPGKKGPGRQNPRPRPRRQPVPGGNSAGTLPECKNVTIGPGLDMQDLAVDVGEPEMVLVGFLEGLIHEPIEQALPGLNAAVVGIPGVCLPDNGSGPGGLTSFTVPSHSGGSSSHGVQTATLLSAPGTSVKVPSTTNSVPVTPGLTYGQTVFGARLVADTGLNPQLVIAWMELEQSGGTTPGSAAMYYQNQNNGKGYNDWLNVGVDDTGPIALAKGGVWADPVTAADHTAWFLKGTWGGADSTILQIYPAIKLGPEATIAKITASKWASSHYGGYFNFLLKWQKIVASGVTLPGYQPGMAVGPGIYLTAATGSSVSLQQIEDGLSSVTQQQLSHLSTQDLENGLSSLQTALGVGSSAITTTAFDVPLTGVGSKQACPQPVQAAPNAAARGALTFALGACGLPYQWGAAGPLKYDCSGLVMRAYDSVHIYALDSHFTGSQMDAGPPAPRVGAQLQLVPGDLVFFAPAVGKTATHVGMVISVHGSTGEMVDAPTTGEVVSDSQIPTAIGGSWGGDVVIGATEPWKDAPQAVTIA
jgi:cell wall-associated NlpC family hydrolase